MVRLWSEEIGDAKSVIEPLVAEINSGVRVRLDGGEGFRKDTVEVLFEKGKRVARCIVTFEAWTNARSDPTAMKQAFQTIIGDLERLSRPPAYLLTTRGLGTEAAKRAPEELRTIAAATEADVLAERLQTLRLQID